MTNTLNNVPRELLERLAVPKPDAKGWTTWHTPTAYQAAKELRAFIDSPSPAGVDGLEVVQAVAWLNTVTKEATTHPVVAMDWDDEKEPVESLMPISQHEAIIDGLRGEVDKQELAVCRAVDASNDWEAKYCAERRSKDQLAGLLRDARELTATVPILMLAIPNPSDINSRDAHIDAVNNVIDRIDAALAELPK